MESMVLGSPLGSPSANNPGSHPNAGAQSGPQYLPGFLMGEAPNQGGGRYFQTSPMKAMKSSTGYQSSMSPPTALKDTPKAIRLGKAEKPGGPPVQCLFSRTASPSTAGDFTPRLSTPQISFNTVSASDYSISEGYEESDAGMWVTVFGFPSSAASYILTQAALWGHIVEHKIPSQGNWMHLKFASRMQARKALARNGRMLTDTLMIGVIPCTDSSLAEDVCKENFLVSSTPSLRATPQAWDRSSSLIHGNSTLGTPSTLERSSLRPLTKAYLGAQAEYEVAQQRATPQQNTSLVSKAIEYVFGL